MNTLLSFCFCLILVFISTGMYSAQEIRSGTPSDGKFSNETRAVAFAFGDREDVLVWAEGVASITGSKDVMVVRNQFPTMDELVEVFSQEPEWLFLGGHFDGWTLTNGVGGYDADLDIVPIQINFYRENVVINRGKERRVLGRVSRL